MSTTQDEGISGAAAPVMGRHRSARGWYFVGATLALVVIAGIVGAAWWHHKSPELCFERGWQAFRNGDLPEVAAAALALRNQKGYERHARLLSGAYLLRTGHAEEAIADFEAAAVDEALRPRALTLEGEAWYHLGRFRDAERVLAVVLGADPQAIDARRWLAATLYDMGAPAHAIEQLGKISEQDPSDPRPDRLMAKIFKDHEEFVRAIEHYRESLRRGPDPRERPQILLEFAQVLVSHHDYAEALEVLGECDEAAPILLEKAKCHEALAQPKQAAQCLARALELAPGDIEVLVANARQHIAADEYDRAAELLERAVQIDPHHPASRFELARTYSRMGRPELAGEQLTRMREIQGLQREFLKLREQAQKEIDNTENRYRMGTIARELGDEPLALIWFRAVLGIDPNHRPAQKALAAGSKSPR